MLALVGLTWIESKLPKRTETVVEPLMLPDVAAIVAEPLEPPVTMPVLPTDATVLSDVLQDTLVVMFSVVPSLNVPVAVICCVLPCCIEAAEGPTVKLDKAGWTQKPWQAGINAVRNTVTIAVHLRLCRKLPVIAYTPFCDRNTTRQVVQRPTVLLFP